MTFTSQIVKSQQSDEHIKQLLKAKTSGDSADKYAWASVCTLQESDTSNTFIYAQKALKLSIQSNSYIHRANAYFALSYAHFIFDNNDSAKYYAHKVIESYNHSGKKGRYYTYALNTISAYYLNRGEAKEALKYGLKQLEVAIELKDTLSISNSYTMLCAIYEMQENIEKAIEYAQKALHIHEQTGNAINRTTLLANLASLLLKADKPETALYYCHQAIFYSEVAYISVRDAATAFMLAGESHTQLKNYDSAKYYLEKANTYLDNISTPQSKAKLWMLYANALSATRNYDRAILLLDNAILVAKESNLIKLLVNAIKSRAELASIIGDYQKAYLYLQEYNILNDSLTKVDAQATIADVREKYESDKKDEQITKQNRDNKILTIGMLIALTLTIMIFIQYVQQRRSNRIIKSQSERLTLLMKELHHRVKNNLQIISSLLSLQSFRIKDASASKAVREGQQRIEAMSLIHQRLYTRGNITEINIKEFITDLIDSLQNAYGYHQDNITIKLNIDNEILNVDQAIPLSLIINEIVSNAFKHAYNDQNNSELAITLNKKENNLRLIIADNGIGINIQEWENNEGSFGKELINTFAQQLNGYLNVIVDNGSQFILTIPCTV